jgi:hypothetical protein
MSTSSVYQAPGIYVTQQSSQVTAVSPTAPNTVALVGPTQGYFTFTDQIAISTTTATPLTQQGINPTSIVVSSVGGTVYTAGNYTVTQTGAGGTSATTIQATLSGTGGTIITGTVVNITYQYTNASYFLPRRFSSFNAIQAAYGPAYSASNTLVNPLTSAAQFLFANGSPEVVIQPTSDVGAVATRAGLSGAYPNLASLPDVYFIVPVAAGITGASGTPGDVINVASDLVSYISTLAATNQSAMGLYAPEYTSTVSPSTIAQTVTNKRLVTLYPNNLLAYNPLSGQNISVGGYNLAAATAGFLASHSVQQGLTGQQIAGFAGIPTTVGVGLSASSVNALTASGVSVLVPNPSNQTFAILQGVTTNMSSVNTQEISVVRAIDYLLYDLTVTLKNSNLIGNPTTTNTPAIVQSLVQGVLESGTSSGAISAYTGLSATLSSSVPTAVNVTFSVSPTYPLNFINIVYTINTATGILSSSSS